MTMKPGKMRLMYRNTWQIKPITQIIWRNRETYFEKYVAKC